MQNKEQKIKKPNYTEEEEDNEGVESKKGRERNNYN